LNIKVRDLEISDFDKITNYYFEFYDEVKENPVFGLTFFDEKPSILDEMRWFLDFEKACAEGIRLD
jgi:hypothetical protein